MCSAIVNRQFLQPVSVSFAVPVHRFAVYQWPPPLAVSSRDVFGTTPVPQQAFEEHVLMSLPSYVDLIKGRQDDITNFGSERKSFDSDAKITFTPLQDIVELKTSWATARNASGDNPFYIALSEFVKTKIADYKAECKRETQKAVDQARSDTLKGAPFARVRRPAVRSFPHRQGV